MDFLISNILQRENPNFTHGRKLECYWNFNITSVWFEVSSSLNFSIMASKRHMKVKTVEEKCSAERFGKWNEQQVCYKYGVPKNTFYMAKYWKGRRFCQIWKSHVQTLNERKFVLVDMRTLTKLNFNGFMQKGVKMYPLMGIY